MKKLKQFIIKYGLVISLPIALIVLASFAAINHEARYCKGVVIKISDLQREQFISQAEVLGILKRIDQKPLVEIQVTEINLAKLERQIKRNPYVLQVEASIDMKGILTIYIEQKRPILRVILPDGKQYYVDENGVKLPISKSFTALVPIANSISIDSAKLLKGQKPYQTLDSSMLVVSNYLAKDSFANALIGQISYNRAMEMYVTPRLGEAEIELGNCENLDNKFARLVSFYKTKYPIVGWDKYKLISVKYSNQIVATRN
ncbi:MAG: hypothetical protein SGJ04_05760 [Bacteroidota bacterium]|nr:hypothetical protein [Bacteroidota bacterium]